jgi:RecB family exonuclease
VTGVTRRRTAIVAALAEHAGESLAPLLEDPGFVDGFLALSMSAERDAVDDASLALAAAEGDDTSAMLAQVVLAARAYAQPTASRDPEAMHGRPAMPLAGVGVRLCALLAAAASDDEEDFVRWLASPNVGLDIAQIRSAQMANPDAPLHVTLAQALNYFRGRESRDRAMHAARAMRSVTAALEADGAPLADIVRAAIDALKGAVPTLDADGPDAAAEIAAAAEGADHVWRRSTTPPNARTRVRLLLDALGRGIADDAPWPSPDPSFMAARRDRHERLRPAQDDVDLHDASAAMSTDGDDADPWIWPETESLRTFVAPAMTFSASRLNSFVKCSRQWFFEYLCDAVEDRGSIHATYGKVVHHALEALHRDVREPALVDGRALLDRLQREIDSAFGKSRPEFASQFEYEVSRLQARRAAPKYVDWLVRQSSAAPMEIIEVESVNRLHAGGYDFVGFIDRVDRPVGGGAVTIFDYKTGRVPDDPHAYLDAVRLGDEAQLALYYFMRRARGDDVARVALVSLRDGHDDVRVVALDIVEDGADRPPQRTGAAACSRATLDASLAALVRRCDLLTNVGLSHYSVGVDPPCRFCAYRSSCRERPPDPEPIFVR